MTLTRWTPWHELESMNRQLSRLLEDGGSHSSSEGLVHWAPTVDIRETEDALIVQAELPGIDKKDVKVEVHEGVLAISGERRYEKDVKEKNVHRVERSYGGFARSFSLPANIDSGNVQAEMKDGVLEVRLHKRESAKPKSIEVH
ncbi:MAG: heat-shock protein [Zetaproteobacteria bacterium CG06_land_8_20_14_3_00_59_53]|nr:MAG: heat-shock protein [Zetaproteobacteria bacterium CG2_30_59_37]PIO89513.1 MAG: heat-shock protein [Zetaproteobacteria bacterium CG23_combo_of_CG06-09_8_20_14_all_59_86]PIQ65538.1 MAG: heat-shock protein [Zetaproteobacteria bacterium CG11_big_fil_rev_8_21_14_0_20_59_439]PIU69791.1 MAG: heat-shock protein [Zetaproteobacteria bacterium CG06_land_8_20_14_3_00_59_53]PIU97040.1 MAG: heat-shock protein [Zetaproteobacteria bacterium CG03_land_8_20_14_0_80_59_51]PIY47706.1 MAG: heat-shock protei